MLAAEHPPLSVVMPVHNAIPHLDAAVESILRQTFRDFEFVILDDASTDGSTERLREWAARDHRIRLIELKQNLGPALSSDRVARAAIAPVIARMDADDISCPTRLEDQIGVLKRNADVGLVGGLSETIDCAGSKIRPTELWRLLLPASTPPMNHGTIMYRREVFERVGGYRKACEFWEDCDFIVRVAAISKIMVLPYRVYQYRQSPVSTRVASEQDRVERAVDLMYRARERVEDGFDYDDLLQRPHEPGDKLDPRVFRSVGSITLWSGGQPRVLMRLLERGDLRCNLRTAMEIVWTAWASLHPQTLRAFMRLLLLARSVCASLLVRTDRPVLWAGPALRSNVSTTAVAAE